MTYFTPMFSHTRRHRTINNLTSLTANLSKMTPRGRYTIANLSSLTTIAIFLQFNDHRLGLLTLFKAHSFSSLSMHRKNVRFSTVTVHHTQEEDRANHEFRNAQFRKLRFNSRIQTCGHIIIKNVQLKLQFGKLLN